jgi:hypothetical protein
MAPYLNHNVDSPTDMAQKDSIDVDVMVLYASRKGYYDVVCLPPRVHALIVEQRRPLLRWQVTVLMVRTLQQQQHLVKYHYRHHSQIPCRTLSRCDAAGDDDDEEEEEEGDGTHTVKATVVDAYDVNRPKAEREALGFLVDCAAIVVASDRSIGVENLRHFDDVVQYRTMDNHALVVVVVVYSVDVDDDVDHAMTT